VVILTAHCLGTGNETWENDRATTLRRADRKNLKERVPVLIKVEMRRSVHLQSARAQAVRVGPLQLPAKTILGCVFGLPMEGRYPGKAFKPCSQHVYESWPHIFIMFCYVSPMLSVGPTRPRYTSLSFLQTIEAEVGPASIVRQAHSSGLRRARRHVAIIAPRGNT
jgi:hypothetical protein